VFSLFNCQLRITGKLSCHFLPPATLNWWQVNRRFAKTETEKLTEAVLLPTRSVKPRSASTAKALCNRTQSGDSVDIYEIFATLYGRFYQKLAGSIHLIKPLLQIILQTSWHAMASASATARSRCFYNTPAPAISTELQNRIWLLPSPDCCIGKLNFGQPQVNGDNRCHTRFIPENFQFQSTSLVSWVAQRSPQSASDEFTAASQRCWQFIVISQLAAISDLFHETVFKVFSSVQGLLPLSQLHRAYGMRECALGEK